MTLYGEGSNASSTNNELWRAENSFLRMRGNSDAQKGAENLFHKYVEQAKSNQVKSFLLSHHHSTLALMSEILESMLQTVQKQFTYKQYILTKKTMCRIHIHILSTHSVLFKTYLQLSIHVMHRMYTLYIMYTYIQTIVCGKKLQQILHRPDTQCHGCALHGIQW